MTTPTPPAADPARVLPTSALALLLSTIRRPDELPGGGQAATQGSPAADRLSASAHRRIKLPAAHPGYYWRDLTPGTCLRNPVADDTDMGAWPVQPWGELALVLGHPDAEAAEYEIFDAVRAGMAIMEGEAELERRTPAPSRVDGLRDRIVAAMREHYLRDDNTDADGNMPCRCGDWREPGPMGSDENDWDSHLTDTVLTVVGPELVHRDTAIADRDAAIHRLLHRQRNAEDAALRELQQRLETASQRIQLLRETVADRKRAAAAHFESARNWVRKFNEAMTALGQSEHERERLRVERDRLRDSVVPPGTWMTCLQCGTRVEITTGRLAEHTHGGTVTDPSWSSPTCPLSGARVELAVDDLPWARPDLGTPTITPEAQP